jgi:LysM repeat protein
VNRHVTFTSVSPRLVVTAHPGDSQPVVTDGYGTVETVTRPLRRGLTRWVGSNPPQVSIPILLDKFRTGESVEGDIDDLERMAGLPGGEPLHVKITATGNLVPHAADFEWYITGLDWGDAVLNSKGNRLRQRATVTVTAIIEAATEKSIAKRHKPKHHHAGTYRVKSGDTLKSIAKKVLGDVSRWVAIKRLNNIADPRVVGKPGKKKGAVGTVLKMPKD